MKAILLVFIVLCGNAYAEALQDLNDAIAAVAPIQGVSVGKPSDKSTWRIDFQDTATAQQQVDAQSIITNYDATLFSSAAARREGFRRALYTARGLLDAINEELANDPTNMAIKADQQAAASVIVKLRILAKQ